ncbi:MAG: hypothetical protein K0Q81_1665, partial [Paenibacillus sp.]|nr:hypothetical protein [Paenibacillus sp.]
MTNMQWKNCLRNLSLWLAFCLLSALLPLTAWAEQTETNVTAEQTEFANGGFEQLENGKPVGWAGLGASTVYESVYSPVHGGSYSVKLTDASSRGGNGLRSGPFSVSPGHVYKGSIYAYNETGNSQLYLEFWNAANERIGVQIGTAAVSGQWQLIELTGEAPQGAAYSTLLLYQHQSNVGTAYFDDAAITELPLDFPYNGGFEEVVEGKPAGWIGLGSGVVYNASSTLVLEGAYSVKMEDPSSTIGPGLRSGQIPVVPDNLYRASVQSHNESGTSQLYLEFWNSSNVRIDVKIATNSAVGSWNPISIEAYAPTGAVYATLLLYQHKGNIGITYFDQAEFGIVPPEPVQEFPLLVNSHPRLYFQAGDLPALRARSADNVNAPFGTTGKELWESVLRSADTYLTETEFSLSYYGGKIVTYPLPPIQPGPIPNPPGFNSAYPYWTAMT